MLGPQSASPPSPGSPRPTFLDSEEIQTDGLQDGGHVVEECAFDLSEGEEDEGDATLPLGHPLLQQLLRANTQNSFESGNSNNRSPNSPTLAEVVTELQPLSVESNSPPPSSVAAAMPVIGSLDHRYSSAISPTSPPLPELKLNRIVLKLTTISEGSDTPSFTVGREGANIGRGEKNEVCIPHDSCLQETSHVTIEWRDEGFYLRDNGYPHGAAIRIAMGMGLREWPLTEGATFSAGNSVFQVTEVDAHGSLHMEVLAGPLKGERRRVGHEGATLGRAMENTISIADRELSRRHSKIEFCQESSGYYLVDVGSTNGTYMQLVGPFAGARRIHLSDHILVGRTGFSVNRFDWGVWEDRGRRRTMEDKSTVIQDLGLRRLTALGLGPQTFMAVYDGHGGAEASAFLWQHLHLNLAQALDKASGRIKAALEIADPVKKDHPSCSDNSSFSQTCNSEDNNLLKPVESIPSISTGMSESSDSICLEAPPPPPPPASPPMLPPGADRTSSGTAIGLKMSSVAAEKLFLSPAKAYISNEKILRAGPTALAALDAVICDVVSKCFTDTDHQFLTTSEHPQCGSTATTVLVLGNRFYSFNVGDSRTILCRSGCVHLVSSDHKPCREDESERIKEAGGLVINKRVMGELAVSRAFGDKEFKMGIKAILNEANSGAGQQTGSSGGEKMGDGEECTVPDQPLITAVPEMVCTQTGPQDEFVLLACDGLFDVFSNEEVVKVIREEMARHGDAQRTAEALVRMAISERYTRDNVTIVLVCL